MLILSLYSALAAYAWVALGLPFPGCLFHQVFGIPCLTCGTTRAVKLLLEGDLAQAAAINPLFVTSATAVLLFDAYASAVLVLKLRSIRVHLGPWASNCLRGAAALTILGNWIYLIANRI